MLEHSLLAKDRQKEAFLLVVVCLLLLIQVALSVYSMTPAHTYWLNLVIGSGSLLFTFIWLTLRSFRLSGKRKVFFHIGLISWVGVAIAASIFEMSTHNPRLNLPLSLTSIFILLTAFYSLLGRKLHWKWMRELGWPVFKSIHWLLVVPFVLLDALLILSKDQLFAYGSLIVFMVFRFSFNRWIYATSVHYPFRKTAAKFYINQLRRTQSFN